jgi:hypothetical protein
VQGKLHTTARKLRAGRSALEAWEPVLCERQGLVHVLHMAGAVRVFAAQPWRVQLRQCRNCTSSTAGNAVHEIPAWSAALRDLSIYAATSGATVWHYRDQAELEAEAIIQDRSGRWIGVEIKLGPHQEDAGAASLVALGNKMAAAGESPPSALLVVVGPGSFAHQRDDGVSVVPIDLVGP